MENIKSRTTKQKREAKIRLEAISFEEAILRHHRLHPESYPDGSFIMSIYKKGYRHGWGDRSKHRIFA